MKKALSEWFSAVPTPLFQTWTPDAVSGTPWQQTEPKEKIFFVRATLGSTNSHDRSKGRAGELLKVLRAAATVEAEEGSSRWYAVQAQPRREHVALLHLRRQMFQPFCPLRPARALKGRQLASTPFFPGYLFVRLDLERQRWRSVNGTVGVIRLVSSGSRGDVRPTPLPEGFVERLQAMGGEAGEIPGVDRLVAGERVRVVGGPLDDLCGILETAGGMERVTVLLNLLSQQTRVQLNRSMLLAV